MVRSTDLHLVPAPKKLSFREGTFNPKGKRYIKTCFEYFGLDSVAVGEITRMMQIQEIIFAKRVLTV